MSKENLRKQAEESRKFDQWFKKEFGSLPNMEEAHKLIQERNDLQSHLEYVNRQLQKHIALEEVYHLLIHKKIKYDE